MAGETSSGRAERVLVTGGAGFIGSHLCRRLRALGYGVTVLDDLTTGARENVADLLADPDFALFEHDVIDPFEVEADLIFNLACPASPEQYQRDPIRTTKTSVLGALHVLDLARRVKARVVHTSTSEVYGDPEVHPQPETYRGNVSTTGPRACYDEGKRCAETLAFDFARADRVDVRVARIFNTYGPAMRVDDGRVVSGFVVQALRGEPLTIEGDGRQTRSFCYVDDLVEALILLARAPPGRLGPVNLGNPEEIEIGKLALLITELTGSCSRLVFGPRAADDPRRRCPDIGYAASLLNWRPRTPLRQGLVKTIAYFRDALNGTASNVRTRGTDRAAVARETL